MPSEAHHGEFDAGTSRFKPTPLHRQHRRRMASALTNLFAQPISLLLNDWSNHTGA
jgi:hypothetical protein